MAVTLRACLAGCKKVQPQSTVSRLVFLFNSVQSSIKSTVSFPTRWLPWCCVWQGMILCWSTGDPATLYTSVPTLIFNQHCPGLQRKICQNITGFQKKWKYWTFWNLPMAFYSCPAPEPYQWGAAEVRVWDCWQQEWSFALAAPQSGPWGEHCSSTCLSWGNAQSQAGPPRVIHSHYYTDVTAAGAK